MSLQPLSRKNWNETDIVMELAAPEQILNWAIETYASGLVMATAFGPEGCILLAMLAGLGERGRTVRVFNLETGYQFEETLAMKRTILEKYGIDVEWVRPGSEAAELEMRSGKPLYSVDPAECCRLRKVEPLRRSLIGHTAWISSIRRDQTPDRSCVDIVDWDEKFNLVKISPLANWSRKDVWGYIRENDVPYNPLHDQGYASIGCYPCTIPIRIGESERSGRWAGTGRTECGLHSQERTRE